MVAVFLINLKYTVLGYVPPTKSLCDPRVIRMSEHVPVNYA